MNKRSVTIIIIVAAIAAAVYLGLWNRHTHVDTRSDAEKLRVKALAQKVLQFRFPGIATSQIQFRNAFVQNGNIDIHDISISYAGQNPVNLRIERARYPIRTAESDRYNYAYDIKGLSISLDNFPPPAAFAMQQLGYEKLVFDISGKQSLGHRNGIYQLEFSIAFRGDARLKGFIVLDQVTPQALREAETGNYQRLLAARFINARLNFEDTGLVNKLMRFAIGQDRGHLAKILEQRKTISHDPREINAITALQGLLSSSLPLIVTAHPRRPVRLDSLLMDSGNSVAQRLDLRISNP
jgi:hypothetical protein